jgi:hypothetical protein
MKAAILALAAILTLAVMIPEVHATGRRGLFRQRQVIVQPRQRIVVQQQRQVFVQPRQRFVIQQPQRLHFAPPVYTQPLLVPRQQILIIQ